MEILHCQWFNFEFPIGWNELGVVITALALLTSLLFSYLNWRNSINEKRARVRFSIKNIDHCFWLTVENTGIKTARNILFSVNSEFLNIIPSKGWQDAMLAGSKTSFFLENKSVKYFPIMPAFDGKKEFTDVIYNEKVTVIDDNIRSILDAKVIIKCSYNSEIWTKKIKLRFTPNQFITEAIIPPSRQKK